MSLKRALILPAVIWIILITGLHLALNLTFGWFHGKKSRPTATAFRVAFIPVTCHLTCPVTDFINRSMNTEGIFEPVRFSGFPEIKEAFLSGYLPATFNKAIKNRRPEIQRLVDGIAKSGKWLDQKMDHRLSASQFVAKNYYHQDPRLLAFVLSKPPDRVNYTNLRPLQKDFEEIQRLGVESGILKGTSKFEDYTDISFAQDESAAKPYVWEGPPE